LLIELEHHLEQKAIGREIKRGSRYTGLKATRNGVAAVEQTAGDDMLFRLRAVGRRTVGCGGRKRGFSRSIAAPGHSGRLGHGRSGSNVPWTLRRGGLDRVLGDDVEAEFDGDFRMQADVNRMLAEGLD